MNEIKVSCTCPDVFLSPNVKIYKEFLGQRLTVVKFKVKDLDLIKGEIDYNFLLYLRFNESTSSIEIGDSVSGIEGVLKKHKEEDFDSDYIVCFSKNFDPNITNRLFYLFMNEIHNSEEINLINNLEEYKFPAKYKHMSNSIMQLFYKIKNVIAEEGVKLNFEKEHYSPYRKEGDADEEDFFKKEYSAISKKEGYSAILKINEDFKFSILKGSTIRKPTNYRLKDRFDELMEQGYLKEIKNTTGRIIENIPITEFELIKDVGENTVVNAINLISGKAKSSDKAWDYFTGLREQKETYERLKCRN